MEVKILNKYIDKCSQTFDGFNLRLFGDGSGCAYSGNMHYKTEDDDSVYDDDLLFDFSDEEEMLTKLKMFSSLEVDDILGLGIKKLQFITD